MYLGAQRVSSASGTTSVTLYLYLHGAGAPQIDLSDVRWVSQLAPGQLARSMGLEGAGNRRVLSYLEVSGPDETDNTSLGEVLDALYQSLATGGKGPIQFREWGADLFCSAELPQTTTDEFTDLRNQVQAFLADGGTRPPQRALTIVVTHQDTVTRFGWDTQSKDHLRKQIPNWTPSVLSIDDDVTTAFNEQHGALFPHVLELIVPSGDFDVKKLGGVAFREAGGSQRILWFSPA